MDAFWQGWRVVALAARCRFCPEVSQALRGGKNIVNRDTRQIAGGRGGGTGAAGAQGHRVPEGRAGLRNRAPDRVPWEPPHAVLWAT